MSAAPHAVDERPPHCSEAEWALRRQLADGYHLIDHFGWTETIFNHVSVRLPGNAGHYLVNPFGLTYDEVTPANLLKIDLDGNLVEPAPHPANPPASRSTAPSTARAPTPIASSTRIRPRSRRSR